LTNSKYAKLAKCSGDSALRDINELLGWRLLLRNAGGGRSTSYRLALTDSRE
jgi:Fic family protein